MNWKCFFLRFLVDTEQLFMPLNRQSSMKIIHRTKCEEKKILDGIIDRVFNVFENYSIERKRKLSSSFRKTHSNVDGTVSAICRIQVSMIQLRLFSFKLTDWSWSRHQQIPKLSVTSSFRAQHILIVKHFHWRSSMECSITHQNDTYLDVEFQQIRCGDNRSPPMNWKMESLLHGRDAEKCSILKWFCCFSFCHKNRNLEKFNIRESVFANGFNRRELMHLFALIGTQRLIRIKEIF